MANQVLSRVQQRFLQVESSYGTFPNSTGTATVAASNCCLVEPGSYIRPTANINRRPDKLGTRSVLGSVSGRKFAEWTHKQSMAGNGAAGVAPDCDPILQAAFGIAPTIVASTSVTYNLSDSIPTLSIYDFYSTPSTAPHMAAAGCACRTLEFALGGDFGEISAQGDGKWCIIKPAFTGTDTAGKSGLTAFPSEPSSPVTNGIPTIGFVGSFTLDGNTFTSGLNAKITLNTGNTPIRDTFGQYYPDTPGGDVRTVTLDFEMYTDDSSALSNLITKSAAGGLTGITATLVSGNVAGNTWTFTLRNLLVPAPEVDDSSLRYKYKFTGCLAQASSITAKDELTLVIT